MCVEGSGGLMWLVVDGWCKCYVVLLCGWGMGLVRVGSEEE